MPSAKSRSKTTRRKPTKKSFWKRLTSNKKIAMPAFVAVIFGIIGIGYLLATHAATTGPVYVQTANGCWLDGRVWSSAKNTCTTTCRAYAGPYVKITGVSGAARGYCSKAMVPWTTISQNVCINTLHRIFVYDIGCSRRVDQDNVLNARQCQPDYPQYIADSGADHCITPEVTLNTASQSAVNSAYAQKWQAYANTTSGWTGSVSGCKPGNISESARVAQLSAVNFARSLAGLSPVNALSLSSAAQANVQRAALMMDANNTLNHSPPSNWLCYTSAGAKAASQSNLYLGPSAKPLNVIDGYMKDGGDSNAPVGHRRWLLNPYANAFAFGMTSTAAATQVVGLATDTSNNNPSWVGWPSKGYFPNPLEPNGRWSLSAGNSNMRFGQATISVKYNGSAVSVKKYTPDNDYAQPTVVWQMPSTMSKTGTYTVTVSNITNTKNTSTYSTSYNVTLFAPY